MHRLCGLLEELKHVCPLSFGELKFQFHWSRVIKCKRMEQLTCYRQIFSAAGHRRIRDLPYKALAATMRQLESYFFCHCRPQERESWREWCSMVAEHRIACFDKWIESHRTSTKEKKDVNWRKPVQEDTQDVPVWTDCWLYDNFDRAPLEFPMELHLYERSRTDKTVDDLPSSTTINADRGKTDAPVSVTRRSSRPSRNQKWIGDDNAMGVGSTMLVEQDHNQTMDGNDDNRLRLPDCPIEWNSQSPEANLWRVFDMAIKAHERGDSATIARRVGHTPTETPLLLPTPHCSTIDRMPSPGPLAAVGLSRAIATVFAQHSKRLGPRSGPSQSQSQLLSQPQPQALSLQQTFLPQGPGNGSIVNRGRTRGSRRGPISSGTNRIHRRLNGTSDSSNSDNDCEELPERAKRLGLDLRLLARFLVRKSGPQKSYLR